MAKLYFYFNLPQVDGLPERDLAMLDNAGYTIDLRHVIVEHVPSSKPASDRTALTRLLRRMRADDVLIVTKLAFLGNSVRDVLATLDRCRKAELFVRCEETGPANLCGATAPIAVKTLEAIAGLERDSASARTREYLAQAKDEGRTLGRPSSLTAPQRARILDRLARGASVRELAKQFQTSRQTIMRIRDAASHA